MLMATSPQERLVDGLYISVDSTRGSPRPKNPKRKTKLTTAQISSLSGLERALYISVSIDPVIAGASP